MIFKAPPQHSARSLLPALQVLEEMGFGRRTCLKGTGILLRQLDDPQARMTLRQELVFYRNALELTGDKLIGLKLGEPYLPQRYGLYGYALLSASSVRHALSFAANFGQLTFSFFTFDFSESNGLASFSMSDPPPIEQDLIDVYLDRDISAARVAMTELLGEPFPLHEVHLAHAGHGRQQGYRDYFGCKVCFSSYPGRIIFSAGILDDPLPQSDPETSLHFQQQCHMLIARLSSQSHFIDDLRMLILARPGHFPDIDSLAEKLHTSTRTLRRRLKAEGSSYRRLLEEIRFELAREYLGDTKLPLDEISFLLGYTEPGTFSHAFRRWSGQPPSEYRKQNTSQV
jgi:AraC-like DNA-binding protein